MAEPSKVLNESSAVFFRQEVRAMDNSGKLVPIEKINKPRVRPVIFRRTSIASDILTIKSEKIIIAKVPVIM